MTSSRMRLHLSKARSRLKRVVMWAFLRGLMPSAVVRFAFHRFDLKNL